MPCAYIRLKMSAKECMEFYQSQAPNAKTYTLDGRSIIFPRRLLRTLVRSNGIHGLFRINYNNQGQFISIEKAGD